MNRPPVQSDQAEAQQQGREAPPQHAARAVAGDVRESTRYRRRAQEAERRAEQLQEELAAISASGHERLAALESQLADAQRQHEAAMANLAAAQFERGLERELLARGARDVELALLAARRRLSDTGGTEDDADPAALAEEVLRDKPLLRGEVTPAGNAGSAGSAGGRAGAAGIAGNAGAGAVPELGRGSRPSRGSAAERSPTRANRLASQARTSGSRSDLVAYMRARRP